LVVLHELAHGALAGVDVRQQLPDLVRRVLRFERRGEPLIPHEDALREFGLGEPDR